MLNEVDERNKGFWLGVPQWVRQDNTLRQDYGGQQIQGTVFEHNQMRGIPRFLNDSAQKSGIIAVDFYANASAGNFNASVDLNLITNPLSHVWCMGVIDKNGTVDNAGGGLVPGSVNSSGTVLEGMEVFSGAKANYYCDKDQLIVKITSTNVGWPSLASAQFYYAVYYDDVGVRPLGL